MTERFDFDTHVLGFKGTQAVTWEDEGETPLLLDLQTAALMSKVHGALNPENKIQLTAFCNAEKWRFCYLVEKAWEDLVQ
ncbi:hypothetical protein [Maricaulis sp.]|uniref:hypothetical protein n=1 Tax=Maricaulis sp. TaxID=1486257 RepID=UPI0026095A50|nr:hypothetical protein [Maricaulis sp.]MDF1769852.1 hypothetical protein [Maricaulis sp.]